jgi:hypothetical protein
MSTRFGRFHRLSVVAVPLVLVALPAVHYGSFSALEAHRAGFVLYCAQPSVHAVAKSGATVPVTYQLRNVAWGPVVIHAASASCSCTKVPGLPLTIPAGGVADLRVEVSVSNRSAANSFFSEVDLYTHPPGNPYRLETTLTIEDNAESH